jgi:hypothetical protein
VYKPFITLRRKLAKSVTQRGVVSTAVRCITRPARQLVDLTHWMSPSFRKVRREHTRWDKEHCVDTAPGNQAGWMADIDSENWSHGRGYHPAPSDSLIQRLANLGVDYTNYTFIDFGSGKGRSLFAASDFPFKRIIGVEFNRFLHETALKNIKTYRNGNQRCSVIEPVHADAAAYEIPHGPMVYYFYDPFAEPVMRPVVDNIVRKLESSNEKCYIIYFNPVFAEYFEHNYRFKRVETGTEFENYWSRTRSGNKDANEFTSELKDAERFVVYESI